ncbi:putative cytochrome c assembly protein [Helianthus anomalus]
MLVPALQSEWLIMHYGLMKHGDNIGVGIQRKLGPLLLESYFTIYLHTRTNKNLQGANSTIVTTLGFLIIWIYYFRVNLL